MKRIRRILHGTDFTPASESAWEATQMLGALFDADLLLLHVLAPPVAPADGLLAAPTSRALSDEAREAAHDALGRLLDGAATSAVKAHTRVEEGPPAERILAVAREEPVDLVVIGTRRRSGLAHMLLGSVADSVLQLAPCPVVTVRPRSPLDRRPFPRPTRLCYATDFSPTAAAAWPWALAVAEAAGAQIELFHGVPFPIADRGTPPTEVAAAAKVLAERARRDAERFLAEVGAPPDRVSIRLATGVPADLIVHWARARSADLIVMGTHGWSGLVRWTLGSVAHHVIQAADCPVMTVGPVVRSEGMTP